VDKIVIAYYNYQAILALQVGDWARSISAHVAVLREAKFRTGVVNNR